MNNTKINSLLIPKPSRAIQLFLVIFLFLVYNTNAQVTPANATTISADNAANSVSPIVGGAYTTLGIITVSERNSNKNDFASGGGTLILTAPTGWKFNPGVGTVAFTPSKDITVATIAVTNTTITVTLTIPTNTSADDITITGIQAKADDGANALNSGNILRTAANPGTASINSAVITNDSTNFGSLSQVVGTMKNLVVTLPGQTFTDGATLAGSGNSGTVTAQTVGTPFNIIKLTATDQFYNVITAYTGAKAITYSGPGISTGGNPSYTTAVTFAAGISTTTLTTSLRKAETVAITAKEGSSYGFSSSNVVINPKSLTITSPAVTSKIYDGTTTATITGFLSGNLSGDVVTLVGTGAFSDKNVGIGKSVTSTSTTGGADAANYTITQPTGLTGNITPASLTITGITANNKTYDGLTTATLTGTAVYNGLQNGETFSVTGTPSSSFATSIAEMGKTVSVTGYTPPNTNYTISQPAGLTADIIAAAPTSASAGSSPICIGASTTLNLNGGGGETGAQIKWYTSSCGGTAIGTGNGFSVSPITTTTYYGLYEGVYTTACASVTVTVSPLPAFGTVSADQTICSGNSLLSDITISSATGSIQWQIANDSGFSSGLTNIGTNSTTLTIAQVGALTSTKYFRAIVTSGVCASITSSTVTVTVNLGSAVGAISSNQTICTGNNPTSNITIASATGNIQWQMADDSSFVSGLTYIGTDSTTLNPAEVGILTSTKYIKAVVKIGGCPAVTSGTVMVTVLPNMTVTAASSSPIVCINTSLTSISHTTLNTTGIGLATGLPTGVSTAFASNTITVSGTPTVSGIFNYSIPLIGSCGNVNATGTITVIALPAADTGANKSIYRGDTTIIGTASVPSNSYSWVSSPSGFTSSISNPTVNPLVNTTYTLTETTPQGCVKSNSVTVSVTDNLVITKLLISGAPTKPGDNVTYQISYSNLNTGIAAQNVVITDLLPATSLFNYISSTPAGTYNAGPNSLSWTIASLAPGSGTITVSGKVGVLGSFGYDPASYYIYSGSSSPTINNSATISNAVTPLISSNVVSNSVSQYCGPSMPATISGQIKSSTGSNVFYFIEVTNNGNITDRFTLTNNSPVQSGQTLTSVMTNMAGDAITQTPWLAPGQKYGFLVQFTTPPGSTPPGSINHTFVKATSIVCATTAITDITTDVYGGSQPNGPDLLISKTASSSSVVAGTNIIYTIVVRNLKSNNAKDVIIIDTLPANVTYLSSTQTGGATITLNGGNTVLTATRSGNYDNTNADIVITITVQTTCATMPSVFNTTTVSNTNGDDNTANNNSNITVTVTPNVADPTPSSSVICSGSSTTITLTSSVGTIDYKWYSAATGGSPFKINGNTYTTGNLTSSTSYYVSQYDKSSMTCESNRTLILVTVVSAPVINSQPVDHNSCSSPASFTYNVTGSLLSQQWQLSTDGGSSWSNITNSGVYSGATSQTLSISNVTGLYGYKYKCLLNSSTCYSLPSNVASIVALPTITGSLSVCLGSTTPLIGSGTPHAATPWASATNAVATVSNTGVVTSVAAGTTVITYMNSNGCTQTATITVNSLPNNTTNGFSATTICAGGSPQLIYDAIDATYTTPYSITYKNNATSTLYTVSVTSKDNFVFTPGDNPTSNTGYTLVSISNATCTNSLVSSFGNSGANLIVRPLPTASIGLIGPTSVCVGTPSPTITFTNPQTVGISVTYTINGNTYQVPVLASNTTNVAVPTTAAGTFVYALVSVVYSTTPSCTQTLSGSATVTINPLPTTPTVGIPTQPDCVTSTGSVVLSSLPASGTINQTGTVTATYTITGSSMTISGLAVGTYNFTVSNGTCTSNPSGIVTINSATINTWNGSSWSNGTPTSSSQAIAFNANYISTGDLRACSCTVNTGVSVTINSGNTLTLTNGLTVNGSLTFEDSASLVQINNVSNSGNITYKRNFTGGEYDYTYWSSPVASQNLLLVSPLTKLDKFYSYNSVNWVGENPSTTTMTVGKGYIIRGIAPPPPPANPPGFYTASFVGVPNNGNQSIAVVGGKTSNLIGNPYPSALYADQFLSDNQLVIQGKIAFWTHNTGLQLASTIITNGGTPGSGVLAYTSDDYASYNLSGGVGTAAAKSPGSNTSIPTGKIAAGQSFFTTSTTAGGTVTYTNTMRLDGLGNTLDNTNFYKTKNPNTKKTKILEKNRVWLNLTNTQGAFKQTLLGYITDATNDIDALFDGKTSDGNKFVDFYTVNQGQNLTIQGRALPFDNNDEVPIGYRSTINGLFTISIDQTDGLLKNQPIYLEDKLTNTVFDLKSGNYTFNTPSGTFNERFVLRFTGKTLSIEEKDNEDGILVLYSKNYKTLIIRNSDINSTVNSVTLYNLTGQEIAYWDVKGSEQSSIQIPIKNLPSEIYIVKVKTNKGENSKKIIIK